VTHEFEHVGRKVMLLNASEIFNPNAQARTILLAIEDATDRKQAEEELQTTNAELQHFAYALTHDLQEPLRMVVNFTELLGQEYAGKLGREADQYISYSVEGALRIEALLKALLAYWEVAEREQGSLAPIDCGAVLAKALLNLQAAIAESGAIVTSDPLPTVVAEEVMLMQLFQNLISNSIKYRGEETPRIHVSAEREAEGWLFAVRDNGIGIDPQDADRVFGMFKRLHGSEIPVRASVLRSVRRLSSARVDESGWNRKRDGRYVQVHNSRPPPHNGRTAARGLNEWATLTKTPPKTKSSAYARRSKRKRGRASKSGGSWTGRARNLKSLSRWRLTTCASLSGTWPHSVN
jgi:two-component sensor histidine kinase